MLKHLTILCLFIALATQSNAQVNLVPDGSFEDYKEDNNFGNFIFRPSENDGKYNRSKVWFMAHGSADLYTTHNDSTGQLMTCNLSLPGIGVRIPRTALGFQYPRTDSCYIGLYCWGGYIDYLCDNNFYREWAGVRLLDSLKENHCYRFSMYVSRAEKTGYNASSLGAYFTRDSLYSQWSPTIQMIYPQNIDSVQIQQNPDIAIWDTNWVEISGIFRAKGGERYLYIGNILKDLYYTPIPIPPYSNPDSVYCQNSYFFIDDVSLYETEEPCGVGIKEAFVGKIKIYPNPAAENVTITLPQSTNKAELLIYTMQGQLLSQTQLSNTQTINTSTLANGLYLFVIQSKGNIVGREKVIITH